MENIHKETSDHEVLSLEPLNDPSSKHTITPATVSLGGRDEESMVHLHENGKDPMLLCSVENSGSGHPSASHHISSDTTFTYASLDDRGNLVLQPIKADHPTQMPQAASIISEGNLSHVSHTDGKEATNAQTTGGLQLVVVGEGVDGDTMAYINIQGDGEVEDNQNEMDTENTHTITLNSADGSTLHTLPASYTQHLEHAYGDLVLVNSSNGTTSGTDDVARANNSNMADIPSEETEHRDDPLLLFSVHPIKLEDQSNSSAALSLRAPVQPTTQQRDSKSADDMLLENVMNTTKGQQDSSNCLEERLPEEETATIEERLATRDSLLPPRRHRRCKPYVCPICQMTFKSNYQFNTHQSFHKGHNLWRCDICKYCCDTAAELKQHKNSMHQDARPYKCFQCELSFPKSSVLEDHIRAVHNRERPHSCSFCNKGFYRSHDLKMHLNLHLGIKSNVCHVCGRQFSHPSNLIRHQRLHTGIKPYVCPLCGKRFVQLILLQKHRTTHQPGAGVCPQCPSTFRSAAGLKKHYKFEHKKAMTLQEATRIVRGHTATVGRRYYCQVCGSQFVLKCDLKKHEADEHGSGTEFHCSSCNKLCTAASVKSHICLSAEEEEKRNEFSVDDPPLPSASVSTAFCKSQNENLQRPGKDLKVEEEEYLVMYITPEGESVSYVMKKGEEGSLDKVLQVNAPISDHLGDDSLQREALPEETIMINVQDRPILNHQQEEHSIMTLASHMSEDSPIDPLNIDQPNTTLHNASDTNAESISFQSMKLEPQSSDGTMDIAQVSVHNNSLLPHLTLTANALAAKVNRKSSLRSIAIKRNLKDLVIKTENSDEIKQERKSDDNVLPLTCKDCGKSFQKRWNYQQHIATHDMSLHRYKCDVCGLTFAYRSTYTVHMKKHNSVHTVHTCPLCKKIYKSKISLTQHHKKEHLRVRPFVCELCQKDFYSKSDYNYHMRIHNKEHPYICFACGRSFAHVSHLHRHERTHTKERPHKCPFCPKKFIQLVTLRIHLKKHEKEVSVEHGSFGNAASCPDGNVEVNLDLGHDLSEDTTQMVDNVAENIGDASSSGLVVTHAGGDPVREQLHNVGGAEVQLGQNIGDSTVANESALSVGGFPPGTIILAQDESDESSATHHQFTSDPTAVVTGMDGDCIAIFVQENLN